MKPDWKDAPEWANWLAMDGNGRWYWHENKPHPLKFTEEWVYGGKNEFAGMQLAWVDSLEQRQ